METDTTTHIKYSFKLTGETFTVVVENTIDNAPLDTVVVANAIGTQPLEQTAFDLRYNPAKWICSIITDL